MLLAALACTFGLISKTKVVVDRHTTFRLNKPHSGTIKIWLFMRLHYFTLKRADLTIVTSNFLAKLVEDAGGKAFVLPDPLPDIVPANRKALKGALNLLMISSFGMDEPIQEAIEAMKGFRVKDVVLYITGNYRKVDPRWPDKVPPNVVFTDFIPEEEFVALLFSVDAAMALTTSEWCMLCGCYEIVAAKKPLITSEKIVLRNYFEQAIFVENTAEQIAQGVQKVLDDPEMWKTRSEEMNERIRKQWNERFAALKKTLEALSGTAEAGENRYAR